MMKFTTRPVRSMPALQCTSTGFGSFMNASHASSYCSGVNGCVCWSTVGRWNTSNPDERYRSSRPSGAAFR